MRRLLLAVAVLTSACAGPERPVIEQFFSASRLRDRTALQPIATVIFEPRERGIVTRFEIVKVDERADSRDRRDVTKKSVTIAAPVATPDGRTIQKTMVISMERGQGGRWMVTAVDDSVSRP